MWSNQVYMIFSSLFKLKQAVCNTFSAKQYIQKYCNISVWLHELDYHHFSMIDLSFNL